MLLETENIAPVSSGETILNNLLSTKGNEEEEEEKYTPFKVIRLKNLSNKGTTIRNYDSKNVCLLYNPIELCTNPYRTTCENKQKGYKVELVLNAESKNLFIPNLLCPKNSELCLFENYSTSIPQANDDDTRFDEEDYQTAVPLCGKIRITVNKNNINKPVFLKTLVVSFKCFTTEYCCFTGGSSKTIRLVNDCKNGIPNYYHPTKHLETSNLILQFKPLTVGTHEYPFVFQLDSNSFASVNNSYYGSTLYRVESQLTVMHNLNNKNNDLIILTDQVNIKRVLPSFCMLKDEALKVNGLWKRKEHNKTEGLGDDGTHFEDELQYSMIISSRLIELGKEDKHLFEIQINLLPKFAELQLHKIKVSLIQYTSIPCLDIATGRDIATSYIKKAEVGIREVKLLGTCNNNNNNNNNNESAVEKQQDGSLQVHLRNLYITDTSISRSGEFIPRCRLIRPFSCEPSIQNPNRAKLKITHRVQIKITLSHQQNTTCPTITFKLPILLVDGDMTSSLCLPTYEKFQNLGNLCDRPPSYGKLTKPFSKNY